MSIGMESTLPCPHCGLSRHNTIRWHLCALHTFHIACLKARDRVLEHKASQRRLQDPLAKETEVRRAVVQAEATIEAIKRTLREVVVATDDLCDEGDYLLQEISRARDDVFDDDLAVLRAKEEVIELASITMDLAVSEEGTEHQSEKTIDRRLQEVRDFFRWSQKTTGNFYGNVIFGCPRRQAMKRSRPPGEGNEQVKWARCGKKKGNGRQGKQRVEPSGVAGEKAKSQGEAVVKGEVVEDEIMLAPLSTATVANHNALSTETSARACDVDSSTLQAPPSRGETLGQSGAMEESHASESAAVTGLASTTSASATQPGFHETSEKNGKRPRGRPRKAPKIIPEANTEGPAQQHDHLQYTQSW
ncbi:hypothetical protein BDP81DRAFT_454635 [Colletotrichum phormii]|uniref:Uncharacterized protein n=1 Tax=Colletotrichum phormii TaxID=359342 RepID=A0AAI9ZGM3_9PEZI|nr:uncharacterized protein BDP81DRAFT_454635 [Colletotrichum phormii]KAK1623230.1 hypothetical protein BDP81DRAFT_454635 [Colletotrichum phormii]